MQQPFSCVPDTYHRVSLTLSPKRLGRYLPVAGGDQNLALRFYAWNTRLCEAMYVPVQFAEISSRNAIHKALQRHYGINWNDATRFRTNLPIRFRDELGRAEADERAKHGSGLEIGHIVSALSFGFWVNLTTQSFGHLLWRSGMRVEFPDIPKKAQLHELHTALDSLRIFRNRIAHHNAIFDKSPTAQYQNARKIIGWVCADTVWLQDQISRVSTVINERPRL